MRPKLSQPSFPTVTIFTPHQLQDPHFHGYSSRFKACYLISRMQQQEKQLSERQLFHNFVAADADKFSDVQYGNFPVDVLNLLQKYK